MKKGDYLSAILRSSRTIFSAKDIMLLWGDTGTNAAKVRINYYVKGGALYRVRRGIYAKDKTYNKFELATKIFTPAYVSFETVLARAGVVFQYYDRIFTASYLTREIVADNGTYSYKRIKAAVLTARAGIENQENYAIASPERAFLDVIYSYKDYHFDNLSPLNWDRVYEILPIYGGNKRMGKKVKQYHEAFKAGLK
ncbi:MAG: hypothetical protein Q7R35_19540 [Elusimicrobiota bacterium]|nr:hypothetical protein [Elusimicrobiota bacterium]